MEFNKYKADILPGVRLVFVAVELYLQEMGIIAQIAPPFAPAVGMPNVLLPAELLVAIKKEDALLGTSS